MLKNNAIVWLGEFVQFQLSRKNIFLTLGIIAVVPPLLFWLDGRPDYSMEKAVAGSFLFGMIAVAASFGIGYSAGLRARDREGVSPGCLKAEVKLR